MIKSTSLPNIAVRLFTMLPTILLITFLLSVSVQAQIAPDYEVAAWHGFKPAAITYTFDDNTSNQLAVAIPLFNQYDVKATLFTVTNWGPDWKGLQAASAKGHEIASHTVSHPNLNTLSVEMQEKELQESQRIINANISDAASLTIAYPNCNIADKALLEKYYIAGRICSGALEPKTPNDFYKISSIIAGSQGTAKTAKDFNDKALSAKTAKGWAVFLMHGIDNDGGYSPLPSSELKSHLEFMNTHTEDYWVATFRKVVQYIKERDAISMTETVITSDSLRLTVTDNLDNAIYNVPVTVRRLLPSTWKNAKVYVNKEVVNSAISDIDGKKYIVFDVIPDKGEMYLSNADHVVAGLKDISENPLLKAGPNPFEDSMKIEAGGSFQYFVYSLDGRLTESGQAANIKEIGKSYLPGIYLLKISYRNQVYGSKIIKR